MLSAIASWLEVCRHMIEIACVCGNRLKVQDEHAGLSIKCPKCRKLVAVAVPAAAPITETIPPPGLSVDALDLGNVPPPEEPVVQATAGPDLNAPALDPLLREVERLTSLCRSIRLLLAAILGVLAALLLMLLVRN